MALLISQTGCDTDPDPNAAVAEVAAPSTAAPDAPPAAAPAADDATTVRLAVSPPQSRIGFVGAKVTDTHSGAFERFEGEIELRNGDPTASKVDVTIAIASLVADVPKLTRHLKSPDLLDASQFPEARFVSTAIVADAGADSTHRVTGDFTLHGVTRSITFPAKIAVDGQKVVASAKFKINRKDFGINYPGMPDDLIEDQVLIDLQLRGDKAADPT